MVFSHATLCLRPKVCRCKKGMVIENEIIYGENLSVW